MLCASCGQDSRNTRVCEWCNKSMTAAPVGGAAAPKPPLAPLNAASPLNGSPPVAPLNNPAPLAAPPLYTSPVAQPLYTTPAVSPLYVPPPAVPGNAQTYAAPPSLNATQPMNPAMPNAPTAPAEPPASGRILRTTLTGEVIEVAAPEPTMMLGAPNPTANAQAVGMMPPMNYPGPNAGLPPAAMSTAGMRELSKAYDNGPSLGERWEKFLAIALPVLLASIWLIHALPNLFMWVSIGAVFVLSVAIGATAVVPSFDDAYADVSVMLLVAFLFGPLIALVVHVIVGLIKQEINGAIVGLFLINLITRFLFIIALFSVANSFGTFALVGFFNVFEFVAVFLSFGGWMLSSMFRPLDAA